MDGYPPALLPRMVTFLTGGESDFSKWQKHALCEVGLFCPVIQVKSEWKTRPMNIALPRSATGGRRPFFYARRRTLSPRAIGAWSASATVTWKWRIKLSSMPELLQISLIAAVVSSAMAAFSWTAPSTS